jgi:hypothetical protein
MLSQKWSRINFKMTDLQEYQQVKSSRNNKAMDTTPEKPSGAAASRTPVIRKPLLQTSNRSTPGTLRASTPDPEQSP